MKTSIPPGTSNVQTFQRLTKKPFITRIEFLKPKHCYIEVTLAVWSDRNQIILSLTPRNWKGLPYYAIKNNLNKTLRCVAFIRLLVVFSWLGRLNRMLVLLWSDDINDWDYSTASVLAADGALTEWRCQWRTEVFGNTLHPVTICPLQMPHGIVRVKFEILPWETGY